MKITRISRMQDCGVFRDFRWPSGGELPEFGDFNLIYGWNGTGKTTISRIFRNLELRQTPSSGRILLNVDGQRIDGAEFPIRETESAAIRVFNRDFVRDNVFRDDRGNLPPIFVLGEQSARAQEQIEKLRHELDGAVAAIASATKAEGSATSQFNSHMTITAGIIKRRLRGPDDEAYANYDRRPYQRHAQQMLDEGSPDRHRLAADERESLYQVQSGDYRDEVELLTYEPLDVAALVDRVSALLSQTALSPNALAEILADAQLSEWIRQGLAIHSLHSADTCLYCKQPMPATRTEELRRHFDDAYERLSSDVQSALDDCDTMTEKIEAAQAAMPARGELYPDLASEYDAAESQASAYFKGLVDALEDVVSALTTKAQSLHQEMSIMPVHDPTGADSLDALNRVLAKHNRRSRDFDAEVSTAKKRLEADLVADHLASYNSVVTALNNARTDRANAEQNAARIRAEIQRWEIQVRNHLIAAEQLNTDLRDYLGHDQFQLEVRDNGYVIMRDGVPADDPSEGEVTAIALLYFLRSLDADEFDLEKGVVVLDDPVSSLDSNTLYMAVGAIRARTHNAGQLFILTHNFGFFREMKRWSKRPPRRNQHKQASVRAEYYMLDASLDGDARTSSIRRLDRLLRDYESDYHYLFSRVYSAAKNPQGDLEANYELPNICRRLLEGFLTFKYPSVGSEQFWAKMDRVEFDEVKKAQIYRFVNAYSHNNAINAPEHDFSQLSETKSVLTHVIELIERLDEEHYRGLVELADRVSAQSTAE